MSVTKAIATTLVLLATSCVAQQQCSNSIEPNNRVDCSSGAKHLTQELCISRGCCFDASAKNNTCYFSVPAKPVTKVHMINSNHFDAGYADLTAVVLNEYFDTYFPRAATVGAALRADAGTPLKWMTFSYIVSLYMDCPSGMGLHCPTAEAKAIFSDAVKARDIVWPAFPTNAELAIADASSLTFGVLMANKTSEMFDVPPSAVLSDRDVPGLPRSSIPILKKAGIKALTEGMNGRMVPVNVPPIFMWEDPASAESMLTMWHWGGYGQIGDPGNPIRVPGSSHALLYNWRGDNAGPPTKAAEIAADIAKVQPFFPDAEIVPSTFDEFVDAINADGAQTNLPTVTSDLADTWAWGMASDPIKLQRARAIQRVRTECESGSMADPACSTTDARYFNFSRLIQKNLEHTWGISVFHYGNESNVDWDNVNFHQKIANGEPNFAAMVASWNEQRDWGINFAVEALGDHPLVPRIEAEFANMKPNFIDPAANGFAPISGSDPISGFGTFKTIQFGTDGSIIKLTTASGLELADESHKLGLARYQTLVLSDFEAWQEEYINPGAGGGNEYGKPASFMNAKPTPKHNFEAGTVTKVWKNRNTILIDLTMDADLVQFYGSPESLRINVTASDQGLLFDLLLLNKTSTRLPEAFYFTFNPVGSGEGAANTTSAWKMDKLGSWVDPLDVAYGASRALHCVADGVRFTPPSTNNIVMFKTWDAALARWDAPLPFPTPIHRQPDLSQGLHYLLLDNIWNTNYPFWIPFNADESNLKFRFAIEIQ